MTENSKYAVKIFKWSDVIQATNMIAGEKLYSPASKTAFTR